MDSNDKINILIVDDRPENLLALESILATPELNIVKAVTGREALRQILLQDFALMLLDVQMPVMNGFELAKIIKQRQKSLYVPIIFLTAISKDSKFITEGYAAGAVDYLLKPIDPYVLRSKVNVFVEMHRQNLALQSARNALKEANESLSVLNGTLEEKVQERTAEILQLNQELEKRVAERTAEMQAAYKELETFSYTVSHDLRTPLRHITSFSERLLSKCANNLDEESVAIANRINSAAERMTNLVEDLLAFSMVAHGEVGEEQVDLSAIAARIGKDLKRSDSDRAVDFNVGGGCLVEGDPKLLQLALENLLSNAWKFTSKKGKALIEFGALDQPNGEKTYFVRDNGIGFDMAHATKLFNVFERLHSFKDYPGTGVGLATVQRIIQRHGGRIWAESKPGEGASFFFSIN